MTRFLLFLIVVALIVGGVGYYLQWFHVNVDEAKIKKDTAAAEEKARELGAKAGEEARELGNKAKGLIGKDGQNKSPTQLVTFPGQIKEPPPPAAPPSLQ